MDFKERKVGEVVWGFKVKFKNESEDEHVLSNAPKYMPYIIIKKEDNEYYVMLVTNKPNSGRKHFCLSKNKYSEMKNNLYVKLDQIYKLKRTDIVKNYFGDYADDLILNEKDYRILLDYIRSARSLDDEDAIIFNTLYEEVNPLDIKDVISIKENDEFKEYTIFNQINEDEFFALKTDIPYNMTKTFKNMSFDYSDIRKFSKNDTYVTKYSNILANEEINKINERVKFYRPDLFQTEFNKKYEFGTIINVDDSEYVVLEDEDDFIYLTKRRDFYEVLTISKLPKEKVIIEEIGMLDIKTRIKLLKRLEWDIKEIWTPQLQKEVVEKIKSYRK